MKKTCTILSVLMLLMVFISGCSQQREKTDNGALIHEKDSTLNQLVQENQPSEDVEMLPCVFNSLDEMVSHIKETSGEITTDPIKSSVNLGSLTYFYAPLHLPFLDINYFKLKFCQIILFTTLLPMAKRRKDLTLIME